MHTDVGGSGNQIDSYGSGNQGDGYGSGKQGEHDDDNENGENSQCRWVGCDEVMPTSKELYVS
jgi:hypothetical protein